MENKQQTDPISENPIKIFISEDKMNAYLFLAIPQEGQEAYKESEIYDAIAAAGVKGQVNKDVISQMLSSGWYGSKRLICEGIPVRDGVDGYFEYFFHQKDEKSGKPRVLDDGSVDYTSVNTVGTVSEGDLIAIYHPAIPGHFGYTVTGELLKPKIPKGYPVPQLNGCRYDESTYSYYATIDGKVEATNTKLQVTQTLQINKNVNVAFGSIYFMGDIEIYGDVDSGVEITASGSVTIGGSVQGASIMAGENITIRGGILGDDNTRISCGGDLEARFMQYVNVVAGGNVTAKSILDCNVRAGGMVLIEDTNGLISGGFIYSTKGIDGQAFGNKRSVKTILSAGKNNKILADKVEFPRLIQELDLKLTGINSREIQLDREAKKDPTKKKSNMLHIIRQNKARILAEKKQLEAVYAAYDNMNNSANARTIIKGRKFFPGVIVEIDNKDYSIDFEMILVSFRNNEEGISYVQESDE